MSNLVAGMCRSRGGGVGGLGVRDGSLTGGVSSRWSRLFLKPLRRKSLIYHSTKIIVTQTLMLPGNLQIHNSISKIPPSTNLSTKFVGKKKIQSQTFTQLVVVSGYSMSSHI